MVLRGSVEKRFCDQGDAGVGRLQGAVADTGTYAEPELVNDLDLVLIAPSSRKWLPWFAAPPPIPLINESPGHYVIAASAVHPATRAEDHLNNVEMASVERPEVGTWHVSVRGYRIRKPSQRFTLAANFPLHKCSK